MLEKLPKYEGRLTNPPWSRLTLTADAVKSLKSAALRNCDLCRGLGYTGEPCLCDGAASELPLLCEVCHGTHVKVETAQICRCVNRPLGPGE